MEGSSIVTLDNNANVMWLNQAVRSLVHSKARSSCTTEYDWSWDQQSTINQRCSITNGRMYWFTVLFLFGIFVTAKLCCRI